MTDEEMKEQAHRVKLYEKCKNDLGDIQTVARIIEQNKQGTLKTSLVVDNARLIGEAVLKWTYFSDEAYEAFMELTKKQADITEEYLQSI